MRRTILAAAALAAMGGTAWAEEITVQSSQPRLVQIAPTPVRDAHGQLDWTAIKKCAADPDPRYVVSVFTWRERERCRDLLAARLDGWRAAGRPGEPPE